MGPCLLMSKIISHLRTKYLLYLFVELLKFLKMADKQLTKI